MPDCVKYDKTLDFNRSIKKETWQIPIGQGYTITAKCVIETPEMLEQFVKCEGSQVCKFGNYIKTPVEVYCIDALDCLGMPEWHDRNDTLKLIDEGLKATEADIVNINYAKKLLS